MNLHLPSETKTDHQLNLTIFIQSQTIRVGNSSKFLQIPQSASKKKNTSLPLLILSEKNSSRLKATLRPSVSYPKKTGVSGLRKSCRNSLPSGKTVRLRSPPTPVTRRDVGPLQWHVECSEESPQKIKGLKSRGGG